MTKRHYTTDGVMVNESFIDADGVLHGRLHQPDREDILKWNQELQKNPDAWKSDDLGMRVELCIPVVDLHYLRKKYPDLNSPDGMVRTIAFKKLMESSEGDPYRVRPKKRAIDTSKATRCH